MMCRVSWSGSWDPDCSAYSGVAVERRVNEEDDELVVHGT